MNLARFPRRRYTKGYTPLEKLTRLSEELAGPNIYIKRDDMLGLTGGGNKTRKLEFLVADALSRRADTLITYGGTQSNHCRLTAAAAAREGLRCRLILEEVVPGAHSPRATGNYLLYHLLGVEKITIVPKDSDDNAELQKAAEQAAAEGCKPYVIVLGGSNPIGATGYVACAEEIQSQLFDMGLNMDYVITPSGSAGTQAGLIAGFWGNNSDISVVGINVSRDKAAQQEKCYKLLQATAEHLGLKGEVPRSRIECNGDYFGPGYFIPTPEMIRAVKRLAATEGILLDPVYTGKAMAGLLDLIRKGRFKKGENVLFLHTGGAPATYFFADTFFR
ncbi:MAG: cytochrome C biogenesis protein CcmE [Phycisphaerae bacterium SM23_30]|nr:MAG: cytochrome C biogenesis protein CcmE [Phycisphaerae bacterium SM23_30]